MNLTDEVYLIKQYIDTTGTFYAKGKYLYGELPNSIKDNNKYVVPVNNVEIRSTPLTGSMIITDEILINMTKDEMKPSYSKDEVIIKPNEQNNIEVINESPVVEEAISSIEQSISVPRKRKNNAS